MKNKYYCTIETNPENLPFSRRISEVQFNKLTEDDRAFYGDSIIYMDEDMLLHIPFKNVRHMQPLSDDKKDYYRNLIVNIKT